MAWSSGTRSLMGDVLSWAGVALAGVLVLSHYEEIKPVAFAALGLDASLGAADAAGKAAGESAEPESQTGGAVVELIARDNGHFHTEAEVNGHAIEVMVDTGASVVALTYEDAEKAGIYLDDKDFTHRVSTANGISKVAPVTLGRVTIENITIRNVEAAVCERGKLQTTLLGMSFLSRLDRFDMRSGRLVLED